MQEEELQRDAEWRLSQIAEDFAARMRNGDSPRLEDYTSEHPDLAVKLGQLLPLVAAMEDAAAAETLDLSSYSTCDDLRVAQVESPGQLQIGSQFGRYKILRRLGEGAMGAVYLAHDEQLDRQVALKVPKIARLEVRNVERFYREARSMATLHHSHLCPVFDVGEVDGQHFISMAYIDGETLSERLRRDPQLTDEETVSLVGKVARALQVAHSAGIVHRDLKPANIMIDSRGEPVIMDFGLARRDKQGEEELTHEGTVIGTPIYMAPEQLDERPDAVGPQADVYSLGVILYELLCGRRPFEGSTTSVLRDLVSKETPAPSSIRGDIAKNLEAVCLKSLAKDPRKRYGSAAELSDALTHVLSSRNGSTKKPASSTSVFLALAVASIALLALGAVVSLSIFRIKTSYGEVIVRVAEGENVEVVLRQEGEVVEVIGAAAGWRVRAAEGKYDLELRPVASRGASDGHEAHELNGEEGAESATTLRLERDEVIVSRDQQAIVTVSRQTRGASVGTEEVVSDAVGKVQGDEVASRHAPPSITSRGLEVTMEKPEFSKNGFFMDSGQRLGQWTSTSVALEDLDGDGDLDAFVGNAHPHPSRVWLNDGHGHFQHTGQDFGCFGINWIAAADLDGDGDLDVAAPDGQGATRVWRNDGKAGFDLAQEIETGQCYQVAIGDVDDDDDPDLLITQSNEPALIYLNDGNCQFTKSPNSIGLASETETGVQTGTLADFDNDGDLDAIIAFEKGPDRIWKNDGTGVFAEPVEAVSMEMLSRTNEAIDIDNDGDLDILQARWRYDVGWLMNDGHGNINRSIPSESGSGYWVTARTADFDRDGDLDVIGTNGVGRVPAVLWLNEGDGDYLIEAERLPAAWAMDSVPGDLDGDGDIDIFQINTGGLPNLVWLNRGKVTTSPSRSEVSEKEPVHSEEGFFVDTGQRLGTWASTSVAINDLDGDGDLDAFVGNSHPHPSRVWLNDGHGRFQHTGQDFGCYGMNWVAAADLDGDGDLDVAAPDWKGATRVWRNDGKASFDLIQEIETGLCYQVAIGDVDGDGDPDLLITQSNAPALICLNDGRGTFMKSEVSIDAQPDTPSGVQTGTLGDFDNDGDLDVYIAFETGDDQIWFNDGKGVFTDSSQRLQMPFLARTMEAVDIDEDGDLDILRAQWRETVEWLVNDGSGMFTGGVHYSFRGFWNSARSADFDGDGDLDVVAAQGRREGAPCCLLLNDGEDKCFALADQFDNAWSWDCAPGDFDGDGDIDVFQVNHGGQPNRVWLNRGTAFNASGSEISTVDPVLSEEGLFVDTGQRLGVWSSTSVALDDLDGDGDLDAFVGNSHPHPSRVWLNDGHGRFQHTGQDFGHYGMNWVAAADFDGDGDPDIAAPDWKGATRVWRNDGKASFELAQEIETGLCYQVAVGDLDDDADLDLLITQSDEPALIYLNDGRGSFAKSIHTIGLESENKTGVQVGTLADLDKDGDLDAFIALENGPDRIWWNDGAGVFTDSGQQFLVPNLARTNQAFDVDHDGDLDILQAQWAWPARWLINDGRGRLEDTGLHVSEWKYLNAARAADFDGDGDLDVIGAMGLAHNLPSFLWLNHGDRGYFVETDKLTGTWAYDCAPGDLDGDGDIDIFQVNHGQQPNRVWLNRRISP